jgi:hypothetical protein
MCDVEYVIILQKKHILHPSQNNLLSFCLKREGILSVPVSQRKTEDTASFIDVCNDV